MYDFANSAYVLVVIAFAFPLFFRQQIVGGDNTRGDLLWGSVLGASVVLAGLIAPWLGSYADVHARHQSLFRICVTLAVGGTFAIALLGPGDVVAASALFLITNASFNLSVSLYDAYLRTVAQDNVPQTSGLAWGVGYLGGIACLLVIFPFIGGTTGGTTNYRAVFLITGFWYLLFSAPLLVTIPALIDRSHRANVTDAPKSTFSALALTFREWRTHKNLFLFIVAFYLLSEATGTLTNFASLFATQTLGFSISKTAGLLLLVQVIGVPATIMSGRLAARLGPKRVVAAGAIGWSVVCVWMFWATTAIEIYLIVIIMGMVVGSTYSAARTCLTLLAPAGRQAQAFGLNAFSGRIAETIAPVVFGLISTTTGNQRLAVLSMLPFLLGGLLVLSRVSIPRQPASRMNDN